MEILGRKEAMEFIHVKSPTTMSKYEAEGRIKYRQPVKKKFYFKQDLIDFLNS